MAASINSKTPISLSVLFFLLICPIAAAKIIHVDDDGPADFNNIQAAINDSNDDDTIMIADGIYTGEANRDIDPNGQDVSLVDVNELEEYVYEPYPSVSNILLKKYDPEYESFKGLQIADKIVYFHQRKIEEAIVQKDFIIYNFDRYTEELLDIKLHWREDLPETLPEVISREHAESIVEGEIRFCELYYVSPESEVFPIRPVPENPCWVVEAFNDGEISVTVIDAVEGKIVGPGIPPPYTAFSLTGPTDISGCSGGWYSWYQNARDWFNTMGYSTEGVIWPTQNKVQSHIQSHETAMFYELAHGGSTTFGNACDDITTASEIETWIADYSNMPFAFIGSCDGMCNTGDNTFSYEFRKSSNEYTVTVGYCGMSGSSCSDECWFAGYTISWQTALFDYLNKGEPAKTAFDHANATYPGCAIYNCMRFAGDENFRVVPVVTRDFTPCSLTISSSSGGTVTNPGEGQFTYDCGTQDVPIEATAEANYHFVNWTGTGVTAGRVANANEASTTITMDADYTAVANFAIQQYNINASAGPNGSIDPNGNIVKNPGEDQQFTAMPDEPNYMVSQWYLDGNSVQIGGTTYTLYNIRSNHLVYVTFRLPITITIYVDANSPNDPGSGTSEDPYKHIQDGIDIAIDGDKVVLAQGTYYENINIDSKGIVLTSIDPNDPNVVTDTVIDGNSMQDSVIKIFDANAVVCGLTIRSGSGYNSGSNVSGGGIYCASQNQSVFYVTISHNMILNNTLTDYWDLFGGGIYADQYCNAIISKNVVKDNQINPIGTLCNSSSGAGIYCAGPNSVIISNQIQDNVISTSTRSSSYSGGGLWIAGGTVTDNNIQYNSIILNYPNNWFDDWINGSGYGGGLYSNGPVLVKNNVFFQNIVDITERESDPGAHSATAIGGGMYVTIAEIANNVISENSCLAQGGSAFSPFAPGGAGTARGGGIYASSTTLSHNTIYGNQVSGVGGPGSIDGPSISEGAGIYSDSTTLINNTIIWDNSPDQLLGQDCNNVTYCDIGDSVCSGQVGNIFVNPCFADPCNSDYHLKSQVGRWDLNSQTWCCDEVTSPCIDTGNLDSDWTDELWPHGMRINMGAYGGTAQASMSPADFGNIADLNHDLIVDFEDFSLFANLWPAEQPLLAEDFDRNCIMDNNDLAIFTDNWCEYETPGLTGYWKFDDANGTTAEDSSGNDNDGTLIHEPVWTTGKFAGALAFDGDDTAVEIDTNSLDVNTCTISLWVYPQSFSSTPNYLFGHTYTTDPWSNRIQLYTDDANGSLNLGLGDSHFLHTQIEQLETQTWYHIALTWDRTSYIVYVNGDARASGTYSGLTTLTTFADIGNDGSTVYRNESFDGIIDEVQTYNRTLSATEIQGLYLYGLEEFAADALEFAETQLTDTAAEVNITEYPTYTDSYTNWITTSASGWTSGFFPGSLWLMYQENNEPNYLSWAQSWTAGLEDQASTNPTQDLVFMIYNTFGTGYRITDNNDYKTTTLQAAQTMVDGCYDTNIGAIVAGWGIWEDSVNIDSMMAVELLFWASKNGGDPNFYDIALSHAYKVIENHIRADGSTYQYVNYDPVTGEMLSKATLQGYDTESTWSRGQAWGLYGFTVSYRETGDPNLLDTTKKLADYFIDNLPSDHVVYWDFNDPNIPSAQKDTSAAAIAASGLIELSNLVNDSYSQKRYYNAACSILNSLCTKKASGGYLAQDANGSALSPGILMEGCYHHPDGQTGLDISDESLSWADYYFIEAVLRYQSTNSH